MKQHLSRGGVIYFFLFAVLLVSCDKSNERQTLNKQPGIDNFSRSEAVIYLEGLQSQLLDPQNGLMKSGQTNFALFKNDLLAKLLKNEKAKMSEVNGSIDAITVDGKPYEVRLESFNPAQLSKLSKVAGDGAQFGVYVDPQYYYDGESSSLSFPVKIVSNESGNLVTKEETWTIPYAADIDEIDDEFNAYIDQLKAGLNYPVFAITMEQTDSDGDQMEKLSKTNAAGYLGFRKVRLKVERDGISDEEFEMWWSQSGYFHEKNRKKFNGNQYTDAYGVLHTFPDVDHKDKWYHADNNGSDDNARIALVPLETGYVTYGIAPWEDDYNAGDMDRKSGIGSYINPDNNNVVYYAYKTYADIFNVATNIVDDGKTIYFNLDKRMGSTSDEDDPYAEGAVYEVGYEEVIALTLNGTKLIHTENALNHGLDDIIWVFGLN